MRRGALLGLVLVVLAAAGVLVLRHATDPGCPRAVTAPATSTTRPVLRPGERLAVDVSHYQGPVDWAAARRDGVRAAYVKATESTGYRDPCFGALSTGARAAGLAVGAYHFFSLCRPGAAQAEAFLRAAPPRPRALPPAVDVEPSTTCRTRPPRAQAVRELKAFVDRVGRAWRRSVVVYTTDGLDQRYAVRRLGPLWERDLVRRPAQPWVVWQARDAAAVDGVSGAVDLDVLAPGVTG